MFALATSFPSFLFFQYAHSLSMNAQSQCQPTCRPGFGCPRLKYLIYHKAPKILYILPVDREKINLETTPCQVSSLHRSLILTIKKQNDETTN